MGSNQGRNLANFRNVGAIQQLSATLIWVGRCLDAVIIFVTLFAVARIYGSGWDADHLLVAFIFIGIFQISTSFFEMYHSWRVVRLRYELSKISLYWLLTSAMLALVLYALDPVIVIDKRIVFAWLISSYLLVCSVRIGVRLGLRYARAAGYDVRKVGFLGANEVSEGFVDTFQRHSWMGMEVIGVFDILDKTDSQQEGPTPLAGDVDALVKLANQGEVDVIYISKSLGDQRQIKELIDRFADSTVSIYYCPSLFEFELINARWDNVFGQPVISIVDTPFNGHRGLIKTVEDVLLLILLGPLVLVALLIISALILITSGRPVFFKQSRYGLDGKQFVMWKFRTMDNASCGQAYSQATRDDPRVTWFGAILRKTSLDELPQYLNVLRGDMSFIGPRPHPDVVNDELRKNIHRYMFRHKIKPGITGLAQVNGFRGETETIEYMQKRLENDLRYIKHWSLWLDIKILFETLFVFSGRNVY